MTSQQKSILAQFNATANEDPQDGLAHALDEMGASLQAVGALRTYFDELSDVAPSPIEVDAKIVAQSYDQEVSSMGDAASHPLAALLGALVNSATTSSQLDAMNQFAHQHCGRGV